MNPMFHEDRQRDIDRDYQRHEDRQRFTQLSAVRPEPIITLPVKPPLDFMADYWKRVAEAQEMKRWEDEQDHKPLKP